MPRYVVRDGDHPIKTYVLIPKGIDKSLASHPILLNWHGGYLWLASGLYPPAFPDRFLPFAEKHNAIIISPNYTVLPNKEGAKVVVEDVLSFHEWLTTAFVPLLKEKAPELKPDLSRVIVYGASSGGYVALLHALEYPDFFKGVGVAYGAVNLDTEFWRKGGRAVGAENPMQLADEVFMDDDTVKKLIEEYKNGPRVSEDDAMERSLFATSAARAGLYVDEFNARGKLEDDESIWLNRRIDKGAKLPKRIWLMHGIADNVVPVATTEELAAVLEKRGGHELRVDLIEDGGHVLENQDWSETAGVRVDRKLRMAYAWFAENWVAK